MWTSILSLNWSVALQKNFAGITMVTETLAAAERRVTYLHSITIFILLLYVSSFYSQTNLFQFHKIHHFTLFVKQKRKRTENYVDT